MNVEVCVLYAENGAVQIGTYEPSEFQSLAVDVSRGPDNGFARVEFLVSASGEALYQGRVDITPRSHADDLCAVELALRFARWVLSAKGRRFYEKIQRQRPEESARRIVEVLGR
jgi:hypothetical protein